MLSVKHVKLFSSLRYNQRGNAFIEFAIAVPVLLVLFFGVTEIARALIMLSKIEKTIGSITDVLSTFQPGTPTAQADFESEIKNITQAVPQLLSPYDATGVYIKLTDYYQNNSGDVPTSGGGAKGWTYSCGPSGTNNLGASGTSSGVNGGVNIPGISPPIVYNPDGSVKTDNSDCKDHSPVIDVSAPMCQGEELLVGEIYYKFTPLLPNAYNTSIGAFTMYKNAYNRTRYNNPSDPSLVLPTPITPSRGTCS